MEDNIVDRMAKHLGKGGKCGKGNAALDVPDTQGRNSRAAQVDEPGPSQRTRSGLSGRSAHPYAHQEHDY